jgi:hypothetical protein
MLIILCILQTIYYFGIFIITKYYFEVFLHTLDYYIFIFVYCAHSEANISVSVQQAYWFLNAAEYRRNILLCPLSGRRTSTVHIIRKLCLGE